MYWGNLGAGAASRRRSFAPQWRHRATVVGRAWFCGPLGPVIPQQVRLRDGRCASLRVALICETSPVLLDRRALRCGVVLRSVLCCVRCTCDPRAPHASPGMLWRSLMLYIRCAAAVAVMTARLAIRRSWSVCAIEPRASCSVWSEGAHSPCHCLPRHSLLCGMLLPQLLRFCDDARLLFFL